MKLTLKEIPLDSPFALINERNFPKAITYPCQLRISFDSTYFPVQAYLTGKYVEKGEIGLSESVIKRYGLLEGTEVDVQTRRTFDSVAHRLIIDKVKGNILNKEDMDAITKGFMNAEISPSHSSAFLLSQHFTEFSLDEIEAMARSFADSGKPNHGLRGPVGHASERESLVTVEHHGLVVRSQPGVDLDRHT